MENSQYTFQNKKIKERKMRDRERERGGTIKL